MSSLNECLDKQVAVITTDGRALVGVLKAFDRSTNLVLQHTVERIIHQHEPTEEIELGVYILRGDTVVCCGAVDEEVDAQVDWSQQRGLPLTSTKHAT